MARGGEKSNYVMLELREETVTPDMTQLRSVLKILDEVEKRRAISPALVQPFMRGIMEAPFPAPGRTITVKNFLPGSGTEVRR